MYSEWICYIWFFRPSNVCLIGRIRGCRSEPSHPVARRRLERSEERLGSATAKLSEASQAADESERLVPRYHLKSLSPNYPIYDLPTVPEYVKYFLSSQRIIKFELQHIYFNRICISFRNAATNSGYEKRLRIAQIWKMTK